MATVTRAQAIAALKAATWFGLSWGQQTLEQVDPAEVDLDRPVAPTDRRLCAAAIILVGRYGPDVLEDRGHGALFPRAQYLSESLDTLTQIANWAETLGFFTRAYGDLSVTDSYVFAQRHCSQKARQHPTE